MSTDARQQTEVAADRIRDELLTTLKELDRRRLEATDLRYQIEKHRTLLLGVAGAGALVAATWITVATLRAKSRRNHRVNHRLEGLRRAWEHPDRVATRADEAPFAVHLGRKVALAFAVALGTRLAKTAAAMVVPPKPKPDPNQYYN